MPAHTHDGIDWATRLADLRQADTANAPAMRAVAGRLIESLPAPHPTVIDVGCGAGGMSAALAEALVGRAARCATGTIDSPAARSSHGSAAQPPNGPEASPEHGHGSAVASPGVGLPARVSAAVGGSVDAGPGVGLPAEVSPASDVSADAWPGGGLASGAAVGGVPAGGTLVLVDVVPEFLASAQAAVGAVLGGSGVVNVRTVQADVADPASLDGLPAADLVWASNVVHHLPDQRAAALRLAALLAPGGCLALSEGGLSMRCLPWDVGVGEPGLQDRLIAAQGTWFQRMRADMPGVVRLPTGWNEVLSAAGLSGVTAFSYLVDVPAPLSDAGRAAVVNWLAWMTHGNADLLSPADLAALHRLLDPADPAYVAKRDDVFMLKASTVHLGWR